jgi:gamma-glutamylputrescine oxidase
MPTHAWLTLNDTLRRHATSWYAASAHDAPVRPAATDARDVDVCVIGAGYTGLNAALELASRGIETTVLEAQRVGWGASGRNGGQVGSGHRLEQPELEAWLGVRRAHELWRLSQAAKQRVKGLIVEHAIDCDLQPGIIYTAHRARLEPRYRRLVAHMRERYNYRLLHFLDQAAARALVRSDDVHCAMLDEDAAHLHPLNFAQGVAAAAEQAGAHIFEQSRVSGIARGKDHVSIDVSGTTFKARRVVLACNGYLGGLYPSLQRYVQPLNSFIAATEPLGEARAGALISRRLAVCDSRFVVNYYRMSSDHRLLFGGGESHGARFPSDIAGLVRKRMLQTFPELDGVGIDHAWGGTLAITPRRMPYFSRAGGQVYVAGGFSGHGVAMATLAGALCARAIDGDSDDFDALAAVPARRFPRSALVRDALMQVAMRLAAWRDAW